MRDKSKGKEEEKESKEAESSGEDKPANEAPPSKEQIDEAVAQLNNLKIIQRLGSLSEDAVVLPGGASFADGTSLDNLDSKK